MAALGNMMASISFIILSRAHVAPQAVTWLAALSAGALTFYIALEMNSASLVIVAPSSEGLSTTSTKVYLS
jgi:surface polysaccharide O-acyltransferase-like enzyme